MSSTTTTTTTETPHGSSLTLQSENTVKADFSYWNTKDLPDVSEIGAIFNGGSERLHPVPSTVTDMRSFGPSSFNLTTHGFQVLKHASSALPPQSTSVPDFHDDNFVKPTYWPELIMMLKSQLGLRSAAALNTTVRDVSKIEEYPSHLNPRANPNKSFQPFRFVHGDYTAAGARGHLRAMLPSYFEDNGNTVGTSQEEQEDFFRLQQEIIAAEDKAMEEESVDDPWQWSGKNYAGPRWGILSVWRPLETVYRDPLAVMDARTLFKKDLEGSAWVPFTRTYSDRSGFVPAYKSENLLPLAPDDGDAYQWYYLSEQKPEEVLALKLFDSQAHQHESKAVYCGPHSAFTLPGTEERSPRRSAEVRVFVIW